MTQSFDARFWLIQPVPLFCHTLASSVACLPSSSPRLILLNLFQHVITV